MDGGRGGGVPLRGTLMDCAGSGTGYRAARGAWVGTRHAGTWAQASTDGVGGKQPGGVRGGKQGHRQQRWYGGTRRGQEPVIVGGDAWVGAGDARDRDRKVWLGGGMCEWGPERVGRGRNVCRGRGRFGAEP